MPALVRFECLGPFFNRLAADDKYSRRNMMNLQQQLQRHYLKNRTIFLQFLLLLSTYIKLEHFDQKMWVL